MVRNQSSGKTYIAYNTCLQAEILQYSYTDKNLQDFCEWLSLLEKSERFVSFKNRFIKIQKALKDEDVGEKRTLLVEETEQLIEKY